jgi:hypothetical protein
MRPVVEAFPTLLHGLFTCIVLLVVADVASPAFNFSGIPNWGVSQTTFAFTTVLTVSLALGIVMQTLSRRLFRNQERLWILGVLGRGEVKESLAALSDIEPAPGRPAFAELSEEEEEVQTRAIKASAFVHSLEYQLMIRAPHVLDKIQVYHDQYRMARGFILPLAILSVTLPFWDPVAALNGVGSIGPFPIIRSQTLMLSILASRVCFVTFQDRANRYTLAKAMAWATMEGIEAKERQPA